MYDSFSAVEFCCCACVDRVQFPEQDKDPEVRGVSVGIRNQNAFYRMDGEFTEEAVVKFVTEYVAGSIQVHSCFPRYNCEGLIRFWPIYAYYVYYPRCDYQEGMRWMFAFSTKYIRAG